MLLSLASNSAPGDVPCELRETSQSPTEPSLGSFPPPYSRLAHAWGAWISLSLLPSDCHRVLFHGVLLSPTCFEVHGILLLLKTPCCSPLRSPAVPPTLPSSRRCQGQQWSCLLPPSCTEPTFPDASSLGKAREPASTDSTWFAVEIAEHLWAGHRDGLSHVRRSPARDVVPDTAAGCRERQSR